VVGATYIHIGLLNFLSLYKKIITYTVLIDIFLNVSDTDSAEKSYEKLKVLGSAPILGQDIPRALAAYALRIQLLIRRAGRPQLIFQNPLPFISHILLVFVGCLLGTLFVWLDCVGGCVLPTSPCMFDFFLSSFKSKNK
jgi:hypothetical protein